jgi:hypothetical protein
VLARTVIKRGLQAVGAIALVLATLTALLYFLAPNYLGASRIERESLSPSGQYRVIHAVTSTGAVGYCYQFVILVPTNRPSEVPSYGKSKDQAVFTAQCDAQMELEWLDDSRLKVILSLAQSHDAQVIRMRHEDPESHVLLKYEIKTQ